MAKSIMIQGTMSNAGKSLIAAGLCRVFRQDGKRVAISNSLYNPFELVEFVAPSSSPLTIKIKRYYNFSTTEKVVLGYAFVSKD